MSVLECDFRWLAGKDFIFLRHYAEFSSYTTFRYIFMYRVVAGTAVQIIYRERFPVSPPFVALAGLLKSMPHPVGF